MANALVRQEQPMAAQIEQVVISGDLKTLTPDQRVAYYNRVCQSVGLNPYTRPFEYIILNGKLTLYARRDAADQLRSLHGISLSKPHIEYTDDMVMVTIEAVDNQGRTDTDLGAVSIKNLQGENRANAIMKCITKAKRRVTLSLAGLGWLDETEVDSIPGAQRVMVDVETGEIVALKSENVESGPSAASAASEGDVLFMSEEQPKRPVASQAKLNRMHALGVEFHGNKEAWDAARPKWVESASKGDISSSNDLMPKEADWIIASLEKRIAERAEQAQAEPEKATA